MYISFENDTSKLLVTFSVNFVADTKIIFSYDFGAPCNMCVYFENVLGKESEILVLTILYIFSIYFQNKFSYTTVYQKTITSL